MSDDLFDPNAEWASLVMGAFYLAGIRHLVLSPGSRSTPFVLAALRDGRFEIHDVIDERSAAFFALGQSKITGVPSLLLCTSGSALAHYGPALIEASQSYVPLIFLSADRPFELQDCGAPQTIDQVKLFGSYVRAFIELGAMTPDLAAAKATRRMIIQAYTTALAPNPGPVHFNVRARKPLQPYSPTSETEKEVSSHFRKLASEALPFIFRGEVMPDEEGMKWIADLCKKHRNGFIVCGAALPDQVGLQALVTKLSQQTGYPICADAASQLKFGMMEFLGHEIEIDSDSKDVVHCDAFSFLLSSEAFRDLCRAELIIQIGSSPISSAWENYIDSLDGVQRLVFSSHGWNDPFGSASAHIFGDLERSIHALCTHIENEKTPVSPKVDAPTWARHIEKMNALAWGIIESHLDGEMRQNLSLSEALVSRVVVETVCEGDVLALGNSLVIRMVDLVCRASQKKIEVWSQRGANGIDGLISGAAGVASLGRKVTLLLGDVSFIHDLGGLLLAKEVKEPFPIVVVNNDGGRIFEELPLASNRSFTQAEFTKHFVTSHGLSFEQAAKFALLPYKKVSNFKELHDALHEARVHKGAFIIEAKVEPHGARLMLDEWRSSLSQIFLSTSGHL